MDHGPAELRVRRLIVPLWDNVCAPFSRWNGRFSFICDVLITSSLWLLLMSVFSHIYLLLLAESVWRFLIQMFFILFLFSVCLFWVFTSHFRFLSPVYYHAVPFRHLDCNMYLDFTWALNLPKPQCSRIPILYCPPFWCLLASSTAQYEKRPRSDPPSGTVVNSKYALSMPAEHVYSGTGRSGADGIGLDGITGEICSGLCLFRADRSQARPNLHIQKRKACILQLCVATFRYITAMVVVVEVG